MNSGKRYTWQRGRTTHHENMMMLCRWDESSGMLRSVPTRTPQQDGMNSHWFCCLKSIKDGNKKSERSYHSIDGDRGLLFDGSCVADVLAKAAFAVQVFAWNRWEPKRTEPTKISFLPSKFQLLIAPANYSIKLPSLCCLCLAPLVHPQLIFYRSIDSSCTTGYTQEPLHPRRRSLCAMICWWHTSHAIWWVRSHEGGFFRWCYIWHLCLIFSRRLSSTPT